MAKLLDILTHLVEEEAASYGVFITGHSSGAKGLYRFYIDAEGPLNMGVLTDITRKVSARIDETDTGEGTFTFEISSPGADSPLSDIRQYTKHTGRTFNVVTDLGEFEGVLIKREGNILSFEITKTEKINGKKQISTEINEIPFEKIKEATIKISFK